MIYTDYDKLAVMELEDEAGVVSFPMLEKMIFSNPSNIIYCESKEGILSGIISMGDIARADEKGRDYVAVNKNFTSIQMKEYMKAKEIFSENPNINALPVVNEDKKLMGSYSRWEDPFYQINTCDIACVCKYRKEVFLVRPCKNFAEKQVRYRNFMDALLLAGVSVESIEYGEIINYIADADEFVFVDEDECRATDTLYRYILHRECGTTQFYSVSGFVEACREESFGEYFRYLNQNGVYIYSLVWKDSVQNKEYLRTLMSEIRSRCDAVGKKVDNLLDPIWYREFFDDLYSEEYAEKIMNIGYSIETESGCGKLKDLQSELYHVTDGERHTCGQPERYKKTIWFVGACYIFGYYAEDKNTIESFLQKRLRDDDRDIRVVNCGSPAYSQDIRMLCARIQSLPLRRGDILIYGFGNIYFSDIEEINLLDTCRQNRVPAKWMVDHPMHCNHRLYSMYADAVYDTLEPILSKCVNGGAVISR